MKSPGGHCIKEGKLFQNRKIIPDTKSGIFLIIVV